MSERSSPSWSSASRPRTASAISPLTLPTACETPLPPQASPPSRSSVASNSPVEAPEGTAARPWAPEASTTSTSTVGLPRESRIWRACSVSILLTVSRLLVQAGARVVRDLVVGPEIVPVRALGCGQALGALDPAAEAVGGRAQRKLGIDPELAREVDRGEQHVADLVERLLARARVAQLVELAGHRVVGDVVEVEARRRRAALDLARVQRTRQVLGHLAEDAGLPAHLRLLDLVPVAQDLARALRFDGPEDVRVPAHELRVDVRGDVAQRPLSALLEQQGEEVDLEEDVAELVEQLGVIARVRRRGQLVGLLDGVRDDRALVLLAVPRALLAQAPREGVEAPQRLDDLLGRLAHACRASSRTAAPAGAGRAPRWRSAWGWPSDPACTAGSRTPRGSPSSPSSARSSPSRTSRAPSAGSGTAASA